MGNYRAASEDCLRAEPEFVMECMGDLENFFRATEPAMPRLVRAGLAHAQFETIHPFLDGNGVWGGC